MSSIPQTPRAVRCSRPFWLLLVLAGGLLAGCQALQLLTNPDSRGLPPQSEETIRE